MAVDETDDEVEELGRGSSNVEDDSDEEGDLSRTESGTRVVTIRRPP
jgi:hypothetical protein